MKNTSRLAFTMLLCGVLSGCSTSNLETVKGGVMEDYPSVVVGEAFDASPLCSKASWSEFESEQGADIVEFRCAVSLEKTVDTLRAADRRLYQSSLCWDGSCEQGFNNSLRRFKQEGAQLVVQFAMHKDDAAAFDLQGVDILDPAGESCIFDDKFKAYIVPHLLGADDYLNGEVVLQMCLGSLSVERKVFKGT